MQIEIFSIQIDKNEIFIFRAKRKQGNELKRMQD